jgi:hypothetical protein
MSDLQGFCRNALAIYTLLSSVCVTSPAAEVRFYVGKNDYARYEVTRDGIDAVGDWGSSPHVPTIFILRSEQSPSHPSWSCQTSAAIAA